MRGSAISALSNTSTRADYHEQASAAANKNSQQFLPQIVKENNKNWKKKTFHYLYKTRWPSVDVYTDFICLVAHWSSAAFAWGVY